MNRVHQIGMLAAACAGLAFAASAFAGTGEWNVVKDSSSVTFSATEEGNAFQGRFSDFTAKISFDPAQAAQGSIAGTVKTASASTGDATRDSELPSPDWFDTDQYPEAHFESTGITKTSDGYVAEGKLTLKGTTKAIKMPFTFKTTGNGKAEFKGTFTINRFDYKVGTTVSDPNFVSANVTVTITLDLTKPNS